MILTYRFAPHKTTLTPEVVRVSKKKLNFKNLKQKSGINLVTGLSKRPLTVTRKKVRTGRLFGGLI